MTEQEMADKIEHHAPYNAHSNDLTSLRLRGLYITAKTTHAW